ncbi:MAG: endonuclease/exonuclease/phosphatase family protein [Prevotellaceae bacterium]|jgi:endonuclease/exonuclease/phosphatase family metal-dependent hydrolase|nr:endonuclease/exonuclease/phosphatase family protein [Prevotellaceae bacterium]
MIIKRTFYILTFLLNLLLIAAMFVGKASAWISPEQTAIPTLAGLFFPYLAIANCVFIIFWLVRFKWLAVIPIVAMLLFWSELQASFSFFETSKEQPENAIEIKIMTYNVAYFNYYKKSCPIFDYIAQSDADIVCLQEFGFYEKSDQYLSREDVESKMSAYPYQSLHISERSDGRNIGIEVFSKYPIVNEDSFLRKTLVHLPHSRRMHADIKIGSDTVRVFNAYLKSNTLNKQVKTALFEMADNFETSAFDSIATNVFSRIGNAAKIRSIQSQHLAGRIAASPYPVVVCGDFNDTPVSYTYSTIGNNLTDSFIGSGAGMGITYQEHLIQVKIDYLFHSKDIISANYRIEKVKYSDHYPVQASLWLKKND